MKNIFAYTETEYKSYPGYVSYNCQDDGVMTLSVRGKNSSGVQEIEFPLYKFWQFVDAVSNFDLPADVDEIEFLPKVFFEKLATQYAEKESELEAAKQRELELLAVIEKQRDYILERGHTKDCAWNKDNIKDGATYCDCGLTDAIHHSLSKALREHEANVLEEAADWFEDREIVAAPEALRRMAEERRRRK